MTRAGAASAAALVALAGCADGTHGGNGPAAPIPGGALPDPSRFLVIQGNCPPDPRWGHYGRFGYDFDMPLGTPVHAMRAGVVFHTEDRWQNGDHTAGHENGVWIEHADGTVADYVHLSPSSVIVTAGETVEAGDLLGYSGDTGYSAGPHLHVETLDGEGFDGPNTTPLTFSNAQGPLGPNGELLQGESYLALPPATM